MDDFRFEDNAALQRFELRTGGAAAAVAEYQLDGGTLRFLHTKVEPAFEGRGLGSRLAKAALDEVRRRGLKALPQCPFIAGYIGKHPEYQDLVRKGPGGA